MAEVMMLTMLMIQVTMEERQKPPIELTKIGSLNLRMLQDLSLERISNSLQAHKKMYSLCIALLSSKI